MCVYCKRRGANLGCWKQQCRRSYHLSCAIDKECVYEFVEPFKSYCHAHNATNTLNTSATHEETEKCGICLDEMGKHSIVNSLQLICCRDSGWFHKVCLKKSALAFGSDFDCPSCGNTEEFRLNMLMNGIHIPKSNLLPHYDSQEIDEEDVIQAVPKAKRRRIHKNWILVETFSSKKEAEAFIQVQGRWSYYYSNDSSAGLRINYRCNAMKFRGRQCDAGMYILCDSTNESVHLYRTELDHSHESTECKENAVSKIPSEVIAEIASLFEQNQKPKAILYNLVLKGHKPPPKSRLTTLLTKMRKEKFGFERLNYGSLYAWLNESNAVPEEENQPFVVNFDISIDELVEENSEFRFFVSSKRLLRSAITAEKIHTDATYKLIWQGFPVLLVGMTDSGRKFHPFGVSVSTIERAADFEFIFRTVENAVCDILNSKMKPRVLICDAAFAIHNGFENVFGNDLPIIMCWAHVRRNVAKNLPKYIRDKKKQNEFLADLDKLQLARSTEDFEKASKLFIEKWRKVSSELVEYFSQEWLQQHRNWYEGYMELTPSTNNALESFNRVIKDEQTLRERFDLSRFRTTLYNMVKQWSIEYDEGLNIVDLSGSPLIELCQWTSGYQFARSNKKVVSEKRQNIIIYTSHENEESEEIAVDNEWKSFKHYRSSLEVIHTTFTYPVTADNWRNGKCDCGVFFKEFMCPHVIGIALRLKCAMAPPEAKTIPIGQKRKRGRPAKAKSALNRQ